MDVFTMIAGLAGLLLGGALLGLLPLLVGRSTGKPELGKLGMLCSTLSGLILLSLPVAVGFLIAILVRKEDYCFRRTASCSQYSAPGPAPRPAPQRGSSLNLTCLSGPLRGQVYPICRNGLLLGRDPSCGVRFPDTTPGISGRHCCIRWQQGVPVLIDLNSRYGTFQGDGRQLPPNYPVQLAAGSRFYLGDTNCLFQVTLQ